MKKINVAICLMMLLPVSLVAQTYRSFKSLTKDNVNTEVYYLPKTDLVVTFKVEKTTRTKGIYSDNAYLLGIDNTALKNLTSYRVISANIKEKLSADTEQRYFLETDGKVNVEKTSYGTLKTVSTKAIDKQQKNTDRNNRHSKPMPQTMIENSASLPVRPTYEKRLMESNLLIKYPQLTPEKAVMQRGLLTKYPQMTAEKTVAEIKRLREKQIELLSGGWEGTYMNTTVDYMYKQLDEIISSYVALFTGIETVTEEEYTFVVSFDKPIILEEDLLVPICKFSETNGLMDLNEKGEGVKINARIHSYLTTQDNSKLASDQQLTAKQKAKIDKEGVGIYYITPQMAKVTLQGVDMQSCSKLVKLMQYGTVNFTTSHNQTIIFDERTGEMR